MLLGDRALDCKDVTGAQHEIIGYDICELLLFIDWIAEVFRWDGEVDLVFALFSDHYRLFSSPSKLVRVLGHHLKFSGTELSVFKLMAVSAVLERPLAKSPQRALWAMIPRRAFDQMWWMNSSLLILQVVCFNIYNVLSTRREIKDFYVQC